MGKMQRDKGLRVEREIVNYLKDEHVLDAKRVPLSGAVDGFKGDIVINDVWKCEVKARKSFKVLNDWMDDNDVLFLKQDGQSTDDILAVVRLDVLAELIFFTAGTYSIYR
jgi:hypothetical protein